MNFDLTPDQKALQGMVREFAQAEIAPRAEQLDREAVFPTELFQKLGDLGVMSIPFPEELGGMGLGVFEAVLAIEEIARADQSLAVSTMVSVATGLTVARFGSAIGDQGKPEGRAIVIRGLLRVSAEQFYGMDGAERKNILCKFRVCVRHIVGLHVLWAISDS